MAAWLRRILLATAALLAVFGILSIAAHAAGGESPWHAATPPAALAAATLLALAAWKLSARRQFLVVFLLANALLLELLLQAAAWLGVLPGISSKDRCAYGRVYWTAEGRGNSIRNRQGWYAPAFDFAAPRRVAVIGDSLVEAVEVHRTRNAAALLGRRLADTAVFGLGSHGTAPAHHLEVLAYAERHFHPQEAIVVLSLGSDISESSAELSGWPASDFIYYQLAADGRAQLDPASAAARERFARALEFPHSSLLTQAPLILRTHCMTLQMLRSLRDGAIVRARLAERAAAQRDLLGSAEREDLARTGFDPRPFAIAPSPAAEHALAVLLAELRLAREFCAAHGIVLRLVTAPHFPSSFFNTQHGREWSARIGGYDYLAPERAIAAFARAESIPCLPLGAAMSSQKLDVEAIRAFAFLEGTGHFTERGHAYVAEEIERAFYAKP